jgi:hypothetical protein
MKINQHLLCLMIIVSSSAAAHNQTLPDAKIPQRPFIHFNRWQEDWSVLADPNVPREKLDSLKYIRLSVNDPNTYLSFGADLRERFESNDAMNFGIGAMGKPQNYVISRMEAYADLHVASQLQVFIQLQSDFAPGKTILLPVDQDRLSLEQGFFALTEPLGDGTFKFRAGRQQIGFDLQRFISVRDGPNVRQSYDALWADYELSEWRFISFYSQPVQNRNLYVFDDYSNCHLTYGGFRAERKIGPIGRVSSYASYFKNDKASFPSVSGNERRNILDIRFAGKTDSYDWDLEAMGQAGHIANKSILAWAIGSVSGYTFENILWTPRPGLQLDAASGNHHMHSNTLGTFNPLFPNGEYLTLAGYSGYTNFIHFKPSLTLKPYETFSAMLAVAAQWRETTADAVYTQPNIPIPGTVGHGGQYTGTYYQLRLDWQMTPHIHNALEAVCFNIANAIRHAGGHNAMYVGMETKLDW